MNGSKLLNIFAMNLLIFIFALSCTSIGNNSSRSLSSTPSNIRCGEPFVTARLKILNIINNDISQEEIQKNIEIVSKAFLAQYEMTLSTMNRKEKAVVKKAIKMPLSYIHRVPFKRFNLLISRGGLMSPREATKRGLMMDAPFTPMLEDQLFGGYDCIFTTVGPPQGRERYGDVVIYFKNKILKKSWATPWSGWHFIGSIRQNDPEELNAALKNGDVEIGADNRLIFSNAVFAGKDWARIFAYRIITFLRKIESNEKRERLISDLLSETDSSKFWNLIDNNRLGYLEAKSPAFLSFDQVKRIEIPVSKRDEVLSWPKSKNWLHIIKFY